jgi:hypothetical protein
MNDFERYQITGGLVPASEELLGAVQALSEKSGHSFQISNNPVPGTNLFVVHTSDHPFRPEYSIQRGVLGFRVPPNVPDAAPEDSFFIAPADVRLLTPDTVRNSLELNRAARTENFVAGSTLGNIPVLMFSWHIWDRVPWNRRTHTLIDHYAHCVRRFEQPENG